MESPLHLNTFSRKEALAGRGFEDQELENAFAKQLGVPIFLANISQQIFQMARAAGLNTKDHTAILKVLE